MKLERIFIRISEEEKNFYKEENRKKRYELIRVNKTISKE